MADLAHLKSVRAGHKGVLTKKLTEVEDALKATPLDKDVLEQYKVSLEDKSKVLKDLSDQVVSKLQDGTEIAAEIEPSAWLFLRLTRYLDLLALRQLDISLLLHHQIE